MHKLYTTERWTNPVPIILFCFFLELSASYILVDLKKPGKVFEHLPKIQLEVQFLKQNRPLNFKIKFSLTILVS